MFGVQRAAGHYCGGVTLTAADDLRFTVPIYTSAEAARYLDVHPDTFSTWVKGYRKEFRDRPPVHGQSLITGIEPEFRGGPSIPFIGLAEGMFLSALRRAGMPLQQIRPALDLVRSRLGIEHALASRRLFVAGAQLLWEVSTTPGVDMDARNGARDLVVLRDGQYVFRKVVERYLQLISYDEEYARRVGLPRYEVASIVADPQINFGKPYFAHSGTPLFAVRDLLRAGETVEDVAGDFGIPVDQVTEVAQVEGLLVA